MTMNLKSILLKGFLCAIFLVLAYFALIINMQLTQAPIFTILSNAFILSLVYILGAVKNNNKDFMIALILSLLAFIAYPLLAYLYWVLAVIEPMNQGVFIEAQPVFKIFNIVKWLMIIQLSISSYFGISAFFKSMRKNLK